MTPLGDTVLLVAGAAGADCDLPPGVLDIVPAFGVAAVHFDPTSASLDEVRSWLDRQGTDGKRTTASSRLVEIPVLYGGEFGPDLDLVARRAGLTAEEVVRRHAAAEYTVGAVGFQPGFGYLEGLPPELHTPRRATPRTAVPAGAVGIGGPYTGVYPAASPGGWNLIGQTPLAMFDEARPEPSLLRYGDRVRFKRIDGAELRRLATTRRASTVESPPERPLLRVVSPGVQSTLQGLAEYGRQRIGVSPGGAMDTASLRLANLLAGNDPGATAIEATLVGPVFEAIEPITLAVAGAVPLARCVTLRGGERLDLRRLVGGARAYVALAGGFEGRPGRALATDDPLGACGVPVRTPSDRTLTGGGWRRSLRGGAPTLRVLRGPQAEGFDPEAWRRLLGEPYRVTSQSSRMGVRLEGPELRGAPAVGAPSQPVCTGAVQVPPGGQPIVLGADRQTLGGYPMIAAVISADWPALGQLAPGDTVRFAEVTLDEAIHQRKKLERDLALARFAMVREAG